MMRTKGHTCNHIADMYPAHDPIHIDPKEKYGVENDRYGTYDASDNVWIKRPFPVHTLVKDLVAQEEEVK